MTVCALVGGGYWLMGLLLRSSIKLEELAYRSCALGYVMCLLSIRDSSFFDALWLCQRTSLCFFLVFYGLSSTQRLEVLWCGF